MAPLLLAHGIARGGYVGNPDGADKTVVTLDTSGASMLFAAYSGQALHGDNDAFTDSAGITWTRGTGYPVPSTPAYATVSNTMAFYWATSPATSATHVFTCTTANPGQAHASLSVSAWVGVGAYNAQYWSAVGGSPMVLGPIVPAAGLVLSYFTISDEDTPPFGDGLGTVDGTYTVIDQLAQTDGVTGTCGLNAAYRLLSPSASVTAEWTYDDRNTAGGALFAFVADDTPPTPTTTYPIRRQIRWMLPWDDANRMKFLSRLELILQAGIGTTTVTAPAVMLRLSKDGGLTWGNEIDMNAGAMGEFTRRVYANRLGRARNWVAEVTVSDPVDWQFLQAIVDYEEGTS